MHEGIVGVKLDASEIASDPKYEQGDGYDVPAALADKRAENPDLVAIDPDSTEDLGIDRSRKATMLVAATIPAGLAFLFGALAQGFPARRRIFVYAGFASVARRRARGVADRGAGVTPVDVETAFPESPMSPKFRRRLAVLVGLTAVLIPILSWVEAENDRQEEQAFVRGVARRARHLRPHRRELAAHPVPGRRAARGARGRHARPSPGARTRRTWARRSTTPWPCRRRRAGRESASGRRASRWGRRRGRPTASMRATAEAIAAGPAELREVSEAQGAAVDEAGKYGTRQERGLYALGLAAIAASLLGLAGLMGESRAGRTALTTATVAARRRARGRRLGLHLLASGTLSRVQGAGDSPRAMDGRRSSGRGAGLRDPRARRR